MINITRLLARQIRAVFSRCLHPSSRGPFPPVTFQSGPEGLTIRAQSHDAAIELHCPGVFPEERFAVPFDLLKQCEGSKSDDVTFSHRGDGVAVEWMDGGIPQIVEVGSVDSGGEFPPVPPMMQSNEPRLIAALREAVETTDNGSSRYALSCLQLQGESGKVAATDGSQLLIQSGFEFPWDDAVLVPARKVFASRELPTETPVDVGKSDDWACFRIGCWTIQLKIEKESKFPQVEDHIPLVRNAKTTLCLSDGDADFLAKSVKRLPGNKESNAPVTLDLNGEAVIRAMNEDQSSPTELSLNNATRSGDELLLNTNRGFLARAMKLGFRQVHFYGPEAPAFCGDSTRQYVWALLGKEGALKPNPHAIRLESPIDKSPDSVARPKPERKPTTMTRKQSTNGTSAENCQSEAETNGTASTIDTAEKLKTSLQESLSQTRELITQLKRQKKQSRLVQSTLASLRQLQAVDV